MHACMFMCVCMYVYITLINSVFTTRHCIELLKQSSTCSKVDVVLEVDAILKVDVVVKVDVVYRTKLTRRFIVAREQAILSCT